MRREAAFLNFIANRECTGRGATKKAAPFGATLFKEAKWRVSEDNQFWRRSGEWNGQSEMSRTSRVKLFQRLRPLYCHGKEHLWNQNGNSTLYAVLFWEPIQNQYFKVNPLGVQWSSDRKAPCCRMNNAAHWQKFLAETTIVLRGSGVMQRWMGIAPPPTKRKPPRKGARTKSAPVFSVTL
jgi:hypothetical protein